MTPQHPPDIFGTSLLERAVAVAKCATNLCFSWKQKTPVQSESPEVDGFWTFPSCQTAAFLVPSCFGTMPTGPC